jgi:alanyl-tRNA synthetase
MTIRTPALAISVAKSFMRTRGLKAGDLIKQLGPLIKGGGGGQPDFATAGGKEPGGMAEALKKAAELLG